MPKWRNESGRPLSSTNWLKAHHQAKLLERTAFTKLVLELEPRRIVDLGCGPGIWLNLFHEYAGPECEFFGIDVDETSIAVATQAAQSWRRDAVFIQRDIEKEVSSIPEGDVFLAFNVFPYLRDPSTFIEVLKSKIRPGGALVIRQYDGSLLRFGPMDQEQRVTIENALYSALGGSCQFRHYDLDRVYTLLDNANFLHKRLEFELFSRVAPFPAEFVEYFENTIAWTRDYMSIDAGRILNSWSDRYLTSDNGSSSYFLEVDLIAWLSDTPIR